MSDGNVLVSGGCNGNCDYSGQVTVEDILKMAGNVQAELEKAQGALDRVEVEGASGGGLVKVVASAKGRVVRLDVDSSLLSPDQKEMLEDLVVAAFNDARAKADLAQGTTGGRGPRPFDPRSDTDGGDDHGSRLLGCSSPGSLARSG